MRKQTLILFLLLILCGSLLTLQLLTKPVKTTIPARTPEMPMQNETLFPATDRQSPPLPKYPSLSNDREKRSEKLVNKALPLLLKEKLGSYTNLSDLFKSNAAQKMELRSDWIAPYLLPGHNLPDLRLRAIRNPETGDIQFSGGTITLPLTGFEAGYEEGLNADEHKTFLQWKKSL